MMINSCFNSEVWGTVSDWVMVMVTTLTLWFLRRTLKSQLIVQQAQLKITNIENERFIKERKLKFEITLNPEIIEYEGDVSLFCFRCNIHFILLNSDCKNCSILIRSDNSLLDMDERNVYVFDKVYEKSIHTIILAARTPSDLYIVNGGVIHIKIYFQDRADNSFQQEAEITFKKGIINISIDDVAELIAT